MADLFDRGVDADALADEIRALRSAAESYAAARISNHHDAIARLGADLERAAVHYAKRRDEAIRDATQVDYLAIVEDAERKRDASGN